MYMSLKLKLPHTCVQSCTHVYGWESVLVDEGVVSIAQPSSLKKHGWVLVA